MLQLDVRALEDEKKARMGVVECVNHKLIEPFTVLYEKEAFVSKQQQNLELAEDCTYQHKGELVAQFKFTVLLMPSGLHKITGEAVDWDMYETEHDIKDDTIKK
ncbi:proliferation-associated protein 2G4-like isoform X2 [Tachypleus tridentatus]